MKHLSRLFVAVGLCTLLSNLPVAYAQEKANTPPANKQATDELPAVPASILNKKMLNSAKLNTKAKVYFIYMSRHACSICVSEMPGIIEAYKRMKGKKAEIVMLNCGNVTEDTKWVKDAKVPFPVVAPGESAGIPFPYDGPGLLPMMVAVDCDGNKIGQANAGAVSEYVKDWKKVLKECAKLEKKAAKAKKAAQKNEPADDSGAEVTAPAE